MNTLEKLIAAYSDQVQQLEAMLFELLDGRSVLNASGVQLDNLGTIVGLARNNATDADYRTLIAAQIRINRISGEIPDIIDLMNTIVTIDNNDVSFPIQLTESYPASVLVRVHGTVSNPTQMAAILSRLTAAGVNALFIHDLSANQFQFSSTSSVEIDDDHGFGDTTDATVGGELSSVVQS